MIGWVTVADAGQFSFAQDLKRHFILGDRHNTVLRVANLHHEHCYILAVAGELLPVSVHRELGRRTRGLAFGRHCKLVAFVTARFDGPRRVFQHPGKVRVFLHLLCAQAPAVVQQFHFVQVRIDPHCDSLPFASFPIPMWEEMKNGVFGPPRLIVVKRVLGKATEVNDSVL